VALFASPFMLAEERECAAATVAGDIVVVNAETGLVRTKLRLAAEVFSSPVCSGGCLYVGCRDDRLYCLNLA
jgi:acyl-CoA synthetase